MNETTADIHSWARPGAVELAMGVHRVPLSLPIDGLPAVNCYLFTEGDDVVLVDPGWAWDETDRQLSEAFDGLGLRFEDVTRILVTHHHWDHYTQAIRLRRRHGTPIAIGREEHHSLEGYRGDDRFYPNQIALLRAAGAEPVARDLEVLVPQEYERRLEFGQPDEWLHDGDSVRVGNRELRIIATPGHTRGSMVFVDRTNRLLVTGDHVLPRITPSFGLEFQPERFPLHSFLESLQLLKQLPDGRVLPAHGGVTESVHGRVDELLAHHDARLTIIVDRLNAGAETGYDIARGMRWTRRERTLDELAPVHRMTAVIEIAAHLDLLCDQQRARRTVEDGVQHYAAI